MKNNFWKENYLTFTGTIEEERQMTIRKVNADYSQNHLSTKEHAKLIERAEEKARIELAELKKLAHG